jgi:hypothetical protein
MRTGRFVRVGVVAGLAATILAGCHFGGDTFRAKFACSVELTAPVDGIVAMGVNTNVGNIQFDAADVAEVHIAAEIRVKDRTEERAQELAERVRIVAEPSGQTLHIKTVKPVGLKDGNLSVDFLITAPAGLALKFTTNVGTITCTGLRSEISLHTNVGDIRAEYASDAPAAVKADASTNVGRIELAGPREISARLTAETNVGDIDSDRPLTVSGSLKRSINASLGNAEGRISLRTNVGSIQIR